MRPAVLFAVQVLMFASVPGLGAEAGDGTGAAASGQTGRQERREKGNAGSREHGVSDEELFASLDLGRPGLEAVREAVERGDYPDAAAAWAEYFRHRRKPTPHFSREAWPAFIRRELPQLVGPILSRADKVAAGDLSHPPLTLPVRQGRIDWLHNPTKDTNYISIVGSMWLMNSLGRAYLLSGDEKYAKAFAWVFESWYDHLPEILEFQGNLGFNPVFHAYYPGIRSRILVDDYYCLARSPALTPEVHLKLMKHLLDNVRWLEKQNQRYRVGNQQVAAVLGLGIVGMVLPEFKDAERWVSLAEARMKEHLQRDFNADGGHGELCTQYHNTVLRDVGYVVLTAEHNGRPSLLTSEAGPLLERAYGWLAGIVMPGGETPALHSAAFATDWAVHLRIGAHYFQRPDFAWLAQRFWSQGAVPNAKSPFSFANYMINETLSPGELARLNPKAPDFLSTHLDTSGFAVMRTGWEPDDRFLIFQYGWGTTGHAYPGALHFCLAMNDELLATGPGSPLSYRHPAYRYCHSTPSHNLVSIDMRSHASQAGKAVGGKLHTYADLPGAWYVRGDHEGYKKAFGATHARSILVVKDGPILIRDLIHGGAGHEAQWSFHTPLDLAVGEDRSAVLQGRRVYRLVPAFPDEIRSVITDKRWETVLPRDCQPNDCGKVIPVLRYQKPITEDGVQFCVAISEGPCRVEAIGRSAFRLHAGESSYLVLYRDEAEHASAGGAATDAECACIRFQGSPPAPNRAWVVGGRELEIDGSLWLQADSPRTVELPAR